MKKIISGLTMLVSLSVLPQLSWAQTDVLDKATFLPGTKKVLPNTFRSFDL